MPTLLGLAVLCLVIGRSKLAAAASLGRGEVVRHSSLRASGSREGSLSIWPKPNHVLQHGVQAATVAPQLSFEGDISGALVNAAINRYKPLLFPHRGAVGGDIKKVSVRVTGAGGEGYTLGINPGAVTIDAGAEVGVQYALETLSQLVYYDFDRSEYLTQAVLPLKIEDRPLYPHRGLLIDSSRHFLPVASIRNIIRSMSFAKLNRLHWHLTDAQSFPVGSRVEPSLAAKGAWSQQERYSRDDVVDVVDFAAQHGITVVPEFDMPGHMKAWGFGRPDIVTQTYDRFNDGNSAAFNPTKEQSYQLVESTLRDWLVGNDKDPAFFSGSLVHLGTDEMPFSAWQSISEKPPRSIFKDFVNRMVTYSQRLGKQPILWEEGFKDGGNVPKQAIIQIWLDKNVASQAAAAGHKILNSEGWYLDHLDNSWQAMYQRDPAAYLSQDQRTLLLGGEGCMWGETVDGGDLEQTVWPRLGAVAERLWSNVDGEGDVGEAQPRLVAFRCLLLERGVAAGTLGGKGRSSPTGPGSCNQ